MVRPMLPTDWNEESARRAFCWFDVDRVPGDEKTTAWKRRARFMQALWREQRGLPPGAHPYEGGQDATPVGSRIPLAGADESGVNFLTPAVLAAVRARLAVKEPFQMLQSDRIWADLLSSMPLCFNLFGELAHDGEAAARAVRAWWPSVPQGRVTLRFEHSPGRRDTSFLGNQSAFDAAFEIENGDSTYVIGVETKYHEHAKREPAPSAGAMKRYAEVTENSGMFVPGWRHLLVGTDLQQLWLDHLLVLSMLQHGPTRECPRGWSGGRFVLVHPVQNRSFAHAAERYARALKDSSTFEVRTLEDLVGTAGALPEHDARAFAERYL